MQDAPYFSELAVGPKGLTKEGQAALPVKAFWVQASDGVRLRLGHWAATSEPDVKSKGTVLLFPGRTEYLEKYGPTAQILARAGLSILGIDWRGQGMSDRLLDDPMPGHVRRFSDYQQDVTALMDAARALNLPEPYVLLGHSMGGCIGLRALMEGLPVKAAAFSAPMWGIHLSPHLRALAWGLSWVSHQIGLGHKYAPGTSDQSYVVAEPFETNRLTTDNAMYDFMIRQVTKEPHFALAGPTLSWLYEGLKECRDLARRPSPDVPCLILLGSDEDIVTPDRIHDRAKRWDDVTLDLIEGARHEVFMETPEIRKRATDCLLSFYDFVEEVSESDQRIGFVCQGGQSTNTFRHPQSKNT